MADTYMFGSTAAVTNPTGLNGLFNSFSVAISQSIAEGVSFGERWPTVQGLVNRASLIMAGFATSGVASSGLAAMIAAAAAWIGTFKTGNTLAGNVVFTDLTPGTAVEDIARKTVSGRFSGAVTETWA